MTVPDPAIPKLDRSNSDSPNHSGCVPDWDMIHHVAFATGTICFVGGFNDVRGFLACSPIGTIEITT
jgi:hypothetical protein